MIQAKLSDGKTFMMPDSLKDATLEKYLYFMEWIEGGKPQLMKNLDELYHKQAESPDKLEKEEIQVKIDEIIEKVEDPVYYIEQRIPYYASVVAYWTGLSEDYILGRDGGESMEVYHLEMLYYKLLEVFNQLPEPEYTNVLEYNEELWYLREREMKESTVLEYAEAAQFHKNFDKMINGIWFAMPEILCVLVRKEGEKWDKSLLSRKEMFLQWNLYDVWTVAFFFLKRSERYKANLGIYTNALRISRLKQELKG